MTELNEYKTKIEVLAEKTKSHWKITRLIELNGRLNEIRAKFVA